MRPSARRLKPLSILYLDDHLLAVDKPPGVLSAPGRGGQPCAIDLLHGRPELAGRESLRIVHRLDQDASGVLLYARTLQAQRHLVRQFADRKVEKVYYALVTGCVTSDGQIGLSLVYDRRHQRVRPSAVGEGKPSLTHYRVLQRLAGNTLVECRPLTGRLHQVRAHLAAIGHPLTVDPLYGGGQAVLLSNYKPDYRPPRRHPERPLISRLTLHAARIAFVHPTTGAYLTIESPLPKDFRATIRQLGRLV